MSEQPPGVKSAEPASNYMRILLARQDEIERNIDKGYILLNELQQEHLVAFDAMQRANLLQKIERVKGDINKWEVELQKIAEKADQLKISWNEKLVWLDQMQLEYTRTRYYGSDRAAPDKVNSSDDIPSTDSTMDNQVNEYEAQYKKRRLLLNIDNLINRLDNTRARVENDSPDSLAQLLEFITSYRVQLEESIEALSLFITEVEEDIAEARRLVGLLNNLEIKIKKELEERERENEFTLWKYNRALDLIIKRCKKKARVYRALHWLNQLAIIVLGVILIVLVSGDVPRNRTITIYVTVALVLAVLGEQFYRFSVIWKTSRQAIIRIELEKLLFDSKVKPYNSRYQQINLDLFIKNIKEVIFTLNIYPLLNLETAMYPGFFIKKYED